MRTIWGAALLPVLLASTGCLPKADSTDDDTPPAERAFSPRPASRLSRAEYDRTARDLLHLDAGQLATSPSAGFPADELLDRELFPFAVSLVASDLHVSAEVAAAERLADLALEHPERLVTCQPQDRAGEDACAATFVADFAPRAYRRTVTEAERAELVALYAAERDAGGGFLDGIGAIIQGALVSPHFLFHVPLPARATDTGLEFLADEELASRLSYFLWGTMPDDALFAAARSGRLSSDVELETEVRRMLADPRAREAVSAFFAELYGVDRIAGVNRDLTVYPQFTPEVQAALAASVSAFLDDAFWTQDSFAAMWTSSRVYVNGTLSAIYGLGDVTGDTLTAVDGDPTRYAGLLTQPGIMALIGQLDGSDPIHRGLFVRRRLLCLTIPPPPMDIMNNVPPADQAPDATTRERYEAHTTNPQCSGCHSLIDPAGFPLEHFDGIGRWRDTENGKPIDASGAIVGLAGGELLVDGAADLAGKLAGSGAIERCFTRQLYYAATRKAVDAADEAEVDRLTGQLALGGGSFADLMVQIVLSPAFRTRTLTGSPL